MLDPFLMHPPNPPPRKSTFPLSMFPRVPIKRMTHQTRRNTHPATRTPTRPLSEGPNARGFPYPLRDGWHVVVRTHRQRCEGRMHVICRCIHSRGIRHEGLVGWRRGWGFGSQPLKTLSNGDASVFSRDGGNYLGLLAI